MLYFSGTKAPGSGNIPQNTDDENETSVDKGGLSGGAIAGIVIGVLAVIAVIIVIIIVVVIYRKKKRVPEVPERNLRPEPRSSGVAMHSLKIDMPPPSSGHAQPSAPPYNPDYQGSFRSHSYV